MIDSIHSLKAIDKYSTIVKADNKLYFTKEDLASEGQIAKQRLEEILAEADNMDIADIQRAVWNRKKSLLLLYKDGVTKGDSYLMKTTATGRHLIDQLKLKRQPYRRKSYMSPYLSLIVMLGIFAFIWAGTRADPADIDPEGISFQMAYGVVYVLKYIVMFIGQLATLLLGIALSLWFIWIMYKQYAEVPDVVVWSK